MSDSQARESLFASPVCDCGGNHAAYVMDTTPGAGHAVTCPVRLAHPLPHASDCPCHDCQPYDEWVMTSEPFTPLYIGPLPHFTRRMLQALDGYWIHCDGLPKDRNPRSRSDAEDWWGRFEKYRTRVEGEL